MICLFYFLLIDALMDALIRNPEHMALVRKKDPRNTVASLSNGIVY
jgi:hypothetical protein